MTFVLGILGLGFLVFFHELGHFIAARIFGVKVEAFSIGMGPVLVHRTWKETDYRISLIPLGGYCAMKGNSRRKRFILRHSSFKKARNSICRSVCEFSVRISCIFYNCNYRLYVLQRRHKSFHGRRNLP